MSQDPYGNQQPWDPTGQQPYNVDPAGQYGPPVIPNQPGYPPPADGGYYQQNPGYQDPYQYATPNYGVQHVAAGPQNGLGVAALVLGIIAVVLSPCCYMAFTGPTGILAVVFGSIGVQKANRGEATNRGVAMAGLICGIVGLALGLLMVLSIFVWGIWDARLSL
ncbi:DUF4190 domain-containing protein [Stackebrandtia endophytica]|uniref:DUF4190 domain-containing protein n=1 Tax=Stackebrandtia endophytica TaxID=1496996 RepID=UPI0014775347|nr:DUF4190 domain-containing protein [Stackebrandtia endophytica]